MAINEARAALVVQEYRFATAPASSVGAAIRAKYPKARLITIETNTDQAGAEGLASDISSITATLVKVFTVVVEGVLYPEDFTAGAPRYGLVFERHGGVGANPYTVVAAEVDYEANTTTLTVRGS